MRCSARQTPPHLAGPGPGAAPVADGGPETGRNHRAILIARGHASNQCLLVSCTGVHTLAGLRTRTTIITQFMLRTPLCGCPRKPKHTLSLPASFSVSRSFSLLQRLGIQHSISRYIRNMYSCWLACVYGACACCRTMATATAQACESARTRASRRCNKYVD